MFFWTISFTFLLLFISLFFTIMKRARNRELMTVFRAYNEKKDLNELTQWIQERHSALRLTLAMEFLDKIEESELAIQLFNAIGFDAYPTRTIRLYALHAFRMEQKEEALQLAEALLKDHPGDDSILETYIDTALLFERYDDVEKHLLPRLEQKGKGTVFARQHAQLLAARGERERALEIMAEIVKRDYMLYKNTMAPTMKRLIYEQFVASQEIFDRIENGEKERDAKDAPKEVVLDGTESSPE